MTKPFCYYINPSQDPELHGGYVPSIVEANTPGHSPLTGDPAKHQAPWVWGKTLEQAEKTATAHNAKLGLSEGDVVRMVASSMFHATAPRWVKQSNAEIECIAASGHNRPLR